MSGLVAVFVDSGRLFEMIDNHIKVTVIVQVRGHTSKADAVMAQAPCIFHSLKIQIAEVSKREVCLGSFWLIGLQWYGFRGEWRSARQGAGLRH